MSTNACQEKSGLVEWTVRQWPLGLELAPTHNAASEQGWLVKKQCTSNRNVRRGMRLVQVNGQNPSQWPLEKLVQKLSRPASDEKVKVLKLLFVAAPRSQLSHKLQAVSKSLVIVHVDAKSPHPLGIELAPGRLSGDKSMWLVKSLPNDNFIHGGRVRKGMRLHRVNGMNPSLWSHSELLRKIKARPLRLEFLPAPRSATSHRLLSLVRTVEISLKEPAERLSVELVPRRNKKNPGWIVKHGNKVIQEKEGKGKKISNIRRGMALISVNGEDPMHWSRDLLLTKMEERPLSVIFRPAPRSRLSRRLRTSKRRVNIILNEKLIGIELCERRNNSEHQGCLVKNSKHPCIRRGMTLVAVGSVNVRRLGHSLAEVKSLIQESSRPLALQFEAAPVTSRSLSPETADRRRMHRNQYQSRHRRASLVHTTLPSMSGKVEKLGLHLHPRKRGGVVLKRIDKELANRIRREQNTAIRKGFTLLSVDGCDVSVKTLDQVVTLLRERICDSIQSGHQVELVWRPPPHHARSLSPTKGTAPPPPPCIKSWRYGPAPASSPPPPPNNFQEILRVVVDLDALPWKRNGVTETAKLQKSLGLEFAPRRRNSAEMQILHTDSQKNLIPKSGGALVKSVQGWAFKNTEIRRGMWLLRVDSVDVEYKQFEKIISVLRERLNFTRGNMQNHVITHLERCERCHLLLASIECFGCTAQPGWTKKIDEGLGGRVYYHNAMLCRGRGGISEWEKPFGFGGSAKLCYACHEFMHPISKFSVIEDRWNAKGSGTGDASGFLKKRQLKAKRLHDAELQAKGLYDKKATEAMRKAKRPVHRFRRLIQVCEECERRPALWSCQICGHFCASCLNKTHSKGKRAGHTVNEVLVLTSGPGWEQNLTKAEEQQREIEHKQRQLILEAINKVDTLRAARCLQRYFRRKRKKQKQDDERRRRELRRREKALQSRLDQDRRLQWSYRIKVGVGAAPLLTSDRGGEMEAKLREQVLAQPSIFKRGHAALSKFRMGIGAHARLPGLVKVRKGNDVAYTTADLTHLLQRGDCIRIGPAATFRIPGSNNEDMSSKDGPTSGIEDSHQRKSSPQVNGESDDDPRVVSRPRPFTKSILPSNEFRYGEDATLHIYFVQDYAEILQCPPKTALEEIDVRNQAWILKNNQRNATVKNISASISYQEKEELKNAGPGAESEREKAERVAKEKATLEVRHRTMKNRRKLRTGGKNARKNKLKSMKRAKLTRERFKNKLESERQIYLQGNSDEENDD